MSYDFIRRVLFSLDAERAHDLAMWSIATGLVSGGRPVAVPCSCVLFGRLIPHPIGLAAGFDKNALAIDEWESLGFSFVEVGTVTPLPQEGNPKPRLFRLPEDNAIINRMGFNNDGVQVVANRLEARQSRILVGVNIGKNKWTPNEFAVSDYENCLKAVRSVCDYVVVNVSSPNTPGLRDLQSVESISRILDAMTRIAPSMPIAIKLSPDAHDDELAQIAEAAVNAGAQGIVATNTTLSRDGLQSDNRNEAGGLSGMPLCDRATDVCKIVRASIGDRANVIGVGGIFTGEDAQTRLAAGANAVQIYTALVYRGPAVVSEMLTEMVNAG